MMLMRFVGHFVVKSWIFEDLNYPNQADNSYKMSQSDCYSVSGAPLLISSGPIHASLHIPE